MSSKGKAQFRETLSKVREVLEWSEKQDVSDLRSFLMKDPVRPLIGVSSGGASSPIVYMTMLYSTYQGLAKAVTPLSFASLSDAVIRNSKVLILSNSGHGVDPNYTSQRAFTLNPANSACITKPRESNDIIARAHRKGAGCFAYNWPDFGLTGFVSALSNIAVFALIYKAFTSDSSFSKKLNIGNTTYTYQSRVAGAALKPFNAYKHYIVLYAGYGEAVATDIETKFVECGYASVQCCDYRNFTHGRFIFVSNNFDDTCIVMLRTPREKQFSEDLIIEGKGIHKDKATGMYHDLFPADLPVVTIDTDIEGSLASLDLLIKSQVFFSDAALSYGYDPFNPANPKHIDKRALRSKPFKGISKVTLQLNTL